MFLKKPHLTILSKAIYLLCFGILLVTTSCQKDALSEATATETPEKATDSPTDFDRFIQTKILKLPDSQTQNDKLVAIVEQFKKEIPAEVTDLLQQQFEAIQTNQEKIAAQLRSSESGATLPVMNQSSDYGAEVVQQGDFLFVSDQSSQKVHIYHQISGSYSQIQELNGPEGFGSAIAISRNWLAVTAIGFEDFTGEVFIYERQGNQWVQSQVLSPDEMGASLFGRDLAMYGNQLALFQEDFTGQGLSGILVYQLEDGKWGKTTKLANGYSFWSLDMSSTHLVTNSFLSIAEPVVQIFEKTGTSWVKEVDFPLTGFLSRSIVIDNNTVMANTIVPTGLVHVFSKNSGTWQREEVINLPIGGAMPSEIPIEIQGNNAAFGIPDGRDNDAVLIYNSSFRKWRLDGSIEPDEAIAGSLDFGASLTATNRGKLVIGGIGSFCFCDPFAELAPGKVFVY